MNPVPAAVSIIPSMRDVHHAGPLAPEAGHGAQRDGGAETQRLDEQLDDVGARRVRQGQRQHDDERDERDRGDEQARCGRAAERRSKNVATQASDEDHADRRRPRVAGSKTSSAGSGRRAWRLEGEGSCRRRRGVGATNADQVRRPAARRATPIVWRRLKQAHVEPPPGARAAWSSMAPARRTSGPQPEHGADDDVGGHEQQHQRLDDAHGVDRQPRPPAASARRPDSIDPQRNAVRRMPKGLARASRAMAMPSKPMPTNTPGLRKPTVPEHLAGAGQPGERAREGHHRDDRAVDADAGVAGGVGVGADGLHLEAEGGALQDEPHQHAQADHARRSPGGAAAGCRRARAAGRRRRSASVRGTDAVEVLEDRRDRPSSPASARSSTAMVLSMIVMITSWAPVRGPSTPGMPPHSPPPTAPARSTIGMSDDPGSVVPGS